MNSKLFYGAIAVLLCTLLCVQTNAQLSIAVQLRTRTEWRNGQGAPLPKGAPPAFFTSQRTRLNIGYSTYRLKLGVSLQDVGVWGQDVSTINRTTTADNNALMLHEAWAELSLLDTTAKNKAFALKIGRQELVYDDQRLLGNLDWLQQGRRHDAAVLKYETTSWMLHVAGAFNQNKEAASGTVYNSTPAGNYQATTNGGTMYKSLQFLYAGKKWNQSLLSFLFLTDQFSKYSTDTVNNVAVKTFNSKSYGRATTGFYYNRVLKKFNTTASAYYQFGKTATAQKLSAVLLSGAVQYGALKTLNVTAGVDYTSGGTAGTTTHAFDPLYGTPHKFWGLMDYYYAASPFGNGGLTDYYLKAKYKPFDRFLLSADLHQFNSATGIALPDATTKKNLGQEMDLVGSYSITKQVGIEAGYAHYFTTALLTSPAVKKVPNSKSQADWAYVMVNIKPEFLFK